MRRVPLATVAILAAVLIQVTVLNNLPFPGGAAPDLVLVVVVAMALAGGPLEGAIAGFAAGLALDIAPPASGLLGQSALVFCLAGYGCGRLRGQVERSTWLPLAVVALGAAAGEALYALAGLIFGDPDVSWLAVRHVLPAAAGYDVLISPFVLYGVAWLAWNARTDTAPAGMLTGRELAAGTGVQAAHGAVRDTGAGRSPRLRGAAGHRSDGWIGGRQEAPGQRAGAWVDRPRPLRLRLRGGVAGSAAAGPVTKAGPGLPRAAVNLRLASPRRRDGAAVTRRGLAASGAMFGDGGGPGWAGRSARLRGSALAGGPSALRPAGRARKQREARLRLRSKRHHDGGTGGWLGRLRPGAPGRKRRMGRGTFASGAPARPGGAGFAAARGPGATPKFRGLSHQGRGQARMRTAAPRFRRPARWRRARGGLAGSPGSGLSPRRRRWRGRFSGLGKGGLR